MVLSPKRILLTLLKLLALLVVGAMAMLQVPEIRYDYFSDAAPVQITDPNELTLDRFGGSTFVAAAGKADFEKALKVPKYGLTYTYFLVEPYGRRLVCRTIESVNDENLPQWRQIGRFIGRLKPFRRMPFRRTIRAAYRKEHGVQIPDDAFFLAMDDVPAPSGWQIGALCLAAVIWLLLAYFLFLFRRKSAKALAPKAEDGSIGDVSS